MKKLKIAYLSPNLPEREAINTLKEMIRADCRKRIKKATHVPKSKKEAEK